VKVLNDDGGSVWISVARNRNAHHRGAGTGGAPTTGRRGIRSRTRSPRCNARRDNRSRSCGRTTRRSARERGACGRVGKRVLIRRSIAAKRSRLSRRSPASTPAYAAASADCARRYNLAFFGRNRCTNLPCRVRSVASSTSSGIEGPIVRLNAAASRGVEQVGGKAATLGELAGRHACRTAS
jgi:hypothetical protein